MQISFIELKSIESAFIFVLLMMTAAAIIRIGFLNKKKCLDMICQSI